MKNYFIIFLCVFAAGPLISQRNQFSVSAGYALPLGGNSVIENEINESFVTSTGKKFNLGSGVNVQFGMVHFFKSNMALEFAFAYRFHYSRYISSEKTTYTAVSSKEFDAIEANRFYMPQLSSGIYMQSEGKRKLFLRSGVNLGLFPVLLNEYSEVNRMTNSSGTTLQTEHQLKKYNRGFSFGLYTAFGLNLPVSERSSVTIELFSAAQSWSPWFVNYIKYEKSNPGNVEVLPNGKSEIRGVQFPMSCWGLNLGWRFCRSSSVSQ